MATSLGPGSAAALSYAYHLALVAGQLSGLAVSTALFPRLAQLVASGDRLGARTSLAGALRFVWVVGLPVASGLVLLRQPLVRLLFEHGTFDQAATTAVAQPLLWYALAVLADALCQPLWRVVYACRGATTVLGVNSLQTGVRLLANIALSRVMGYTGIAVSAMLGLLLQVVVLAWLVRRRIGNYSEATWWLDMGRITLAGLLAALAMSVPARLLAVRSPGVIVLAGGGLGLLVYTLTLGVMARRSGYFGTDSGRFADGR
jgi:putative peptidoglycan lipid II flippase